MKLPRRKRPHATSLLLLCGGQLLWSGEVVAQEADEDAVAVDDLATGNQSEAVGSDGEAGETEVSDVPPPPLPPLEEEETDASVEEAAGTQPNEVRDERPRIVPPGAVVERKDSFRLHGTVGATKAVAGHQAREYGFGLAGLAAVEWAPTPVWGIQVELGLISLLGADKPAPEGVKALGASTGTHLALGLRFRPFAELSSFSNPEGPWLSAALGATMTGGELAPLMDAHVGYDFPVSEQVSLGPTLGYALILQTQESPRPDNANVLLLGLHGTFDFGPPAPKIVDRDFDGILDEVDKCPDDPEDKDGFQDEDGCPELDNDKDGFEDLVDRCPLDAEDKDGFEDEDGCPELDNDQDGLLDKEDQCPLEPEDVDGFEDEDGCPDPDNDKDNIPDIKDLCPDEPETVNGVADNDGCPDTESIRVVGDKIELDQKIHFWTNSDRIRGMSYPVLDKLATFLKEHPEYVRVDIEGHADSRGNDDFNLELSKRRAHSILRFLAKRGISEDRLSSEGFGSTKPLVEGKTERAHFMNRRVEFVVTRNRTVKVDASDPEAGEPADVPAFGSDIEEEKE